MAEIDNRYAQVGAGARTDVAVDEGLRTYMLRVYNYMAAGIALTGVVAYVIFTYSVTNDPALAFQSGGRAVALHRGMYLTQLGHTLFVSPLKWVLMFAPLAFVLFLSWRIYSMSVTAAQIAFWLYAARRGRIAGDHLHGLHGAVHLPDLLHHGGGVRRAQPVGLYDEEGPFGLGLVPAHGRGRHYPSQHRQHVLALGCAALRDLGDRRAGLRRPHRLRHPADQGQLLLRAGRLPLR